VGVDKVSPTPLAKKLGVSCGEIWGLWRSPDSFKALLAEFPSGVTYREEQVADNMIVFLADRAALIGLAEIDLSVCRRLWLSWPKKSSRLATDLTFDDVQTFGLSLGLVDNKVCAVDSDWTALRFVPRRISLSQP